MNYCWDVIGREHCRRWKQKIIQCKLSKVEAKERPPIYNVQENSPCCLLMLYESNIAWLLLEKQMQLVACTVRASTFSRTEFFSRTVRYRTAILANPIIFDEMNFFLTCTCIAWFDTLKVRFVNGLWKSRCAYWISALDFPFSQIFPLLLTGAGYFIQLGHNLFLIFQKISSIKSIRCIHKWNTSDLL